MKNVSYQIHLPPRNTCWDYSNLHFKDYLRWAENLVRHSRQDLTQDNYDTIIESNVPFEYLPDKKPVLNTQYDHGVLLVHGLLDCPFSMREIGRHLQSRGFLVRSVLLPGHGTTPSDLQDIKIEDWIATVTFGLQSLKKDAQSIWVAGFSGGASLALYHALQDADISALLLIAPSLRLCNPHARYAGLLTRLGSYTKAPLWLNGLDGNDYTKYAFYPVNLAAQAYRLSKTVAKLAQKRRYDKPIWMVLSEDDETIDSLVAKKLFLRQPNTKNRLIWYRQNGQSAIPDTRIIERSSEFPEKNILDFSHTCLPFSSHNNHYGVHGDYTPTTHIPKKNHATEGMLYRGALTRSNLAKHAIKRLTYNPDFEFMLEQLDRFIDNIKT